MPPTKAKKLSRPTREVTATPDTKLAALTAIYDQLHVAYLSAKEANDNAAASLKQELDTIRGEADVDLLLRSEHLNRPLKYARKQGFRLDSPAFKAQQPAMYERYSVPTDVWELRGVDR